MPPVLFTHLQAHCDRTTAEEIRKQKKILIKVCMTEVQAIQNLPNKDFLDVDEVSHPSWQEPAITGRVSSWWTIWSWQEFHNGFVLPDGIPNGIE